MAAPRPQLKYFLEGGRTAAVRATEARRADMWLGIASIGITEADETEVVEQKRLLVHLVLAAGFCHLLSMVTWSSGIAVAVFASCLLCLLTCGVSHYFVHKDHKGLRMAFVGSGLLYAVCYFASESCSPLEHSSGKLFNMVLPTIMFHLPCGGRLFEFAVVLATYVAAFVGLAITESSTPSCFTSPLQAGSSNYLVAVLLTELLPWCVTVVTALSAFMARDAVEAALVDEDAKGIAILTLLDETKIDEALAIADLPGEDAVVGTPIDLAVYQALSQAHTYKNTIVTVSHVNLQPSASDFLAVPSTQVESRDAGTVSPNKPSQQLSPFGNQSPTPQHLNVAKRPSFVGFAHADDAAAGAHLLPGSVESRRASTKTSVSDMSPAEAPLQISSAPASPEAPEEGDGELARPGSLVRRRSSMRRGSSFRTMPMTRETHFVAMICLPQLADYLANSRSEPEMAKLILAEHRAAVRKCAHLFDGTVIGVAFDEIFVKFDRCSDAVSACVHLNELIEETSHHHKNDWVCATRPFDVLSLIVSTDIIVGEVEENCQMGWTSADRILRAVKSFFKTILAPPAVLIADSLAILIHHDFNLSPLTDFGFRSVISVVETDARGLPITNKSRAIESEMEDDNVEFALPSLEDIMQKMTDRVLDGSASFSAAFGGAESVEEGSPSTRGSKRKKLSPEVMELWRKYDVDNSGSLDIDEIREVLDALGIMMNESELQDFYQEVDRDGNGTISLDEFTKAFFNANLGGASAISSVRKKAAAMKIQTGVDNLPIVVATWKKYDTDGSGALDAEELGKVLSDLGVATTPEEVDWMVKKLDKDGNGHVDFEEFASLFSEDVTDIKQNIVKQRIQTVARVMENKRAEQIFSTELQTLRDNLVANAAVITNIMTPIVFCYILYNFGQQLYRASMQNDMGTTQTEIIIDMSLDVIFISWVLQKLLVLPRDVGGHTLFLRKDVILDYVTSVDFWVDFLTILPLDFVYIGYGQNPAVTGTYGYYRLNKLLAVYHLDELFTHAFRGLSPALFRVSNAMMWYMLASHVCACGLILTARDIGEGLVYDMTGTSTLVTNGTTRWIYAFMWAMQQLAGNIRGACLQDPEAAFVLLLITVSASLVIFPVLLAIVGDAVTSISAEATFLDRVDELRSYFSYARRRMNKEEAALLEVDCVRYYRHLFETTGSLDIANNPLDEIPVELAIQVTVETGTEMLRKVPIFKEACENIEFVHELTVKLVPRVVEPGTCVMRKGERGSNMYFISYGEFNIVVDGVGVVFTLRKGNFFGEIALLHNVKRTATIVCGAKYANVLTLDKRDFDEVLQTFPQSLSAISKAAEERLNQILAAEAEEQRKLKEQRLAEQAAKLATPGVDVSNPTTPSRRSPRGADDAASEGKALPSPHRAATPVPTQGGNDADSAKDDDDNTPLVSTQAGTKESS